MQEVAVVQGLQAQVVELEITAGVQRRAQAGQVVGGQLLVQQFGLDAAGDELGEVLGVAAGHLGLGHFSAQDFLADGVQQDTGGDLAVVRVLFDQGTRGQDGRVVHLRHRHAVVQVLQGFLQDRLGAHCVAKAAAGVVDQGVQRGDVQHVRDAAIGHVDRDAAFLHAGHGLGVGLGALVLALLAVQHVGAGHFMLARAHQRQFHVVLHVFDMDGAAVGAAAHQRAHDVVSQLLDDLAHTRGRRALPAVHGEEGLGHGNGDLGRLESHHGAVASNDLVIRVVRIGGVGGGLLRGRCNTGGGATRGDFVMGRLHENSCFYPGNKRQKSPWRNAAKRTSLPA
ncbi:hypothetical protein D9M72_327230 [compost metagenome]